jgi:hypothetical protein
MSAGLLTKPPRLPGSGRPTAGTLSPRSMLPRNAPVGWRYVTLTPRQRSSTLVADLFAAGSVRAAAGLSRRRFLRNVGLGAAIVSGGLGRVLWDPGSALGYDACGPNPFGCGPSEPCQASQCNASGNCKTSDASIERRAKPNNTWPGSYCAGPSAANSWLECCDHQEKLCADCCVGGCGSCGACSGCTTKKKCICRSTTGSC